MGKIATLLGGFAAVVLFAAPVQATTWYVRTSGNDSNTGTSAASAFRTISAAAGRVWAGDTVYVGAGTYAEQVTVPRSGSASAYISYVGDTAGQHTGDAGAVAVGSGGAIDYAFRLSGISYVRIRGFTITDVRRDGIYMGSSTHHIRIEDCHIHSNGRYGVYGSNMTGPLAVVRTTVSQNTTTGMYFYRCTGDLTFTNTLVHNNGGQGVEAKSGGKVNTINCTMCDNKLNGMYVMSCMKLTLRNNIFAFNGKYGVSYGRTALVESHNLLWNTQSAGGGPTDIRADPRFVDRANYDYHLTLASPAVDKADAAYAPADDIDSKPRESKDGMVDMGADEFNGRTIRVMSWREVRR